jgi:hypothetical protein
MALTVEGTERSQAPVSIRAVRSYEERLGGRPACVTPQWMVLRRQPDSNRRLLVLQTSPLDRSGMPPCVPPAGIEPATPTLGTSCSSPLSYEGEVGAEGFEPSGARHLFYRQARLSSVGALPWGEHRESNPDLQGHNLACTSGTPWTPYPHQGSNLGPPRCERGAASAELHGLGGGCPIRTASPDHESGVVPTPLHPQCRPGESNPTAVRIKSPVPGHQARAAFRPPGATRTRNRPVRTGMLCPLSYRRVAWRKARDSNPPRARHPVRRFQRRSSTSRSPSNARRDGDSNPGHPRGCYTLSRRAPRPAGLSPCGTPETIRTSDTRIRNPVLYPLSYRGVVPSGGVEPPVSSISARCLYHFGLDGAGGE